MSSNTSTAPSTITRIPQYYHPKFPPSNSTDVTFRSSDGILFCLHRKNLEAHAESFPGPEFSISANETVGVTEPSEILEIVFDFMYPRKQADIENMPFNVVIQVAEAVEKYQIFSAMKLCEVRLKQLIPAYPGEILNHGIKHDNPALIKGALPRLSRKSLVKAIEWLPPQYHLEWCRHHQAWNNVFRETLRSSASMLPQEYSFISRILEWEALDDMTTLERTLRQDADPRTSLGLSYQSIQIRSRIQVAARGCLEKIKAMTPPAI